MKKLRLSNELRTVPRGPGSWHIPHWQTGKRGDVSEHHKTDLRPKIISTVVHVFLVQTTLTAICVP